MSHTSVRQAEIAVEQAHIDVVYARVEEMRTEARDMRRRGDQLAHGARNEAIFEQASMLFERDVMVRHANQILRSLDAEHEGLVFGRLDTTDGETMHVGRLGVRDLNFDNLVTDWRAPAAAAFYQATAEQPMNVVRRRVIRSTGQSVVDIDDDLLAPDQRPESMAVVGEGALMASLTRARGDKMRDIVATIQKEQDEAIRAPWRGITEITGGPGTGKTAVALHRVAYLLYRDRRRMGGSGVLVIGPSAAFTSYISRVLPSMGEDTVELRSLGEVLDGAGAVAHDTPDVARVKGSLRMRRVLKRALREAPPDAPEQLRITYRGEVLKLDASELARVRRAVHAAGRPPNQSRVDAAEALLEALWRQARRPAGHGSRHAGHRARRAHRLPPVRGGVVADPDRARGAAPGSRTGRGSPRPPGGRSRRTRSTCSRRRGRGRPDRRSRTWRCWTSCGCCSASRRGGTGGGPRSRRPSSRHGARRSRATGGPSTTTSTRTSSSTRRRTSPPCSGAWSAGAAGTRAGRSSATRCRARGRTRRRRRRPGPSALGARATLRRFTLRTNYRNSAEIFELAAKVVGGVADAGPAAARPCARPG